MWFVQVQADMRELLARFRHRLDLQAATDQESIWVRCQDREPVELRSIPHAEFFQLVDENLLRPAGQTLATHNVPQLHWKTLADLLTVELPAAAFCSSTYSAVPISLVPAKVERPSNVLIADRATFASYAISLPSLRLSCWRMAVDQQRVVIWGSPSPSIPGQRFYESHGVAVPAGWETNPVSDPETVSELFALNEGDLALLQAQEQVVAEIVPHDAFIAVQRSVLREIEPHRSSMG